MILTKKLTGRSNVIASLGFAAFVVLSFSGTVSAEVKYSEDEQAFRGLYKQLVEINTTLSSGSCTEAAEAMADRLRSSGIPENDIHIIVPKDWPKQGNLVATLRGNSPEDESVLLLAHIDVVEAKREDWIRDPFTLIEEDGYFFGRGTADDKSMASIFVDIMMRLSRTGYKPEMNLKLALTCGEETPNTFNGARYLLEHHRELLDAKFALNEGGGGRLDSNQRPVYNAVQAGEKVYQDFQLEVTNPGGHSSRPRKDNAINQLALALGKVSDYEFPIEFNSTTRSYFKRLSGMKKGKDAEDLLAILQFPPDDKALERVTANPGYNSLLHTTCVTTMLDAGHAPNALPQRATANVNCRIFPGHKQEEIRQALITLIEDSAIAVTFDAPPEATSPPPPLTEEILGPIETVSKQMWLGVPILPSMIAGGTDGRFLTPAGIPTYGVSGLFYEPGQVNAHGLNEKILVKSLMDGREFLDRLVKIYIGGE
jgi:acetylornithine deacetylase/succinyl-diaminopimelate desuccinylase-like protein